MLLRRGANGLREMLWILRAPRSIFQAFSPPPCERFRQPAGNYETRHLTGGALVTRPQTASPCFRRPGGRLDFGGGGTWHAETPLECAEWRGTVRGNLKVRDQRV